MEWIRGPAIGRGATATVSLATAVPSGEVFAVKSSELCHSMLLQRESYLLSKLSCPRIVKYIGCGVRNETSSNKPTYNLCMEYVFGGTLFEEIQRVGGRLGEEKVRLYTRQILQGLDYLHGNGVVHCDIKSQNILIGEEGAKIADLGCAKLMGKVGGDDRFDTSAFSGTPAFMAPEVARGKEQGYGADIWALGCTIIEMGTGNSPWPELNDPVSALYKIGFSEDVPEIPKWFCEKGKDFVSKCLRRDAKERWTAKELLQHPFVEELDTHLKEVKDSTMDSPSSVLDQAFWDSLDVVESPKNLIPEGISSSSPANRIKKLLQATLSPASNASNWTWNEDWITVRSIDIEETKDCSGESNAILGDDSSFTTPSFLDLFQDELTIESSILDHGNLLDNSIETIIDFSRIRVRTDLILPFDSVTDDSFVSDNLNFQTVNENSCSIESLSNIPSFIYESYS
ncbi:PREDICTED: mitogen-activated protein kinase kinase kinase NPK1 [Theobroma cacao]|uniref:Mitogen-activated protein kinase kinase kinase NPK1 n=1 Tax=Theobroma cacao TaxID=3641 RepID=A0AB32UXE8_THECC|nr:PREDICTED: mitogen-activated protein kinase kinase kinase NPK1 [Theobroma cacao]